MDQNVCRFIPRSQNSEELHVINLVLETKVPENGRMRTSSVYQVYFVRQGTGMLATIDEEFPLQAGDLFFTFPGTPFSISGDAEFEYIYISFLGTRANHIMDRLGIHRKHCFFRDMNRLSPLFENALVAPAPLSDLRTESALLYIFSLIGEGLLPKDSEKKTADAVTEIRKYIDDHYQDPSLSLKTIGEALSYSPKYVSTVFKNGMRIGVCEYINTIRIQHACTLMEQGFTSVKDIALLCGFADPLYFSKAFKKKMHLSPREHIEQLKKER